MIKLSKRLQMAANMVPSSEIIADIGADHGYLIAYLVENNIAKKGFAVENKVGPFEVLKSNLNELNLLDKIECSLSSGISKINENIETVCILGMGGETIYSILKSDEDKLSHINDLIISSHGENDLVFSYLISKGYGIKAIDACYDANKYYEVIHYKKGLKSIKYHELLVENKNEAFTRYLKETLKKNELLLEKDLPLERKNLINKENEMIKNTLSLMN